MQQRVTGERTAKVVFCVIQKKFLMKTFEELQLKKYNSEVQKVEWRQKRLIFWNYAFMMA